MTTSGGRWRGSSYGQARGSPSFRQGYSRGFGFGPSRPPRQNNDDVVALRPPSPPLGPLLTTLDEEDLANSLDLQEYPARITCCKDVASYNWVDEKEPTILVPGLHSFSPVSKDSEL
jgi:hypothetical protein